jgi:hypothetical protein
VTVSAALDECDAGLHSSTGHAVYSHSGSSSSSSSGRVCTDVQPGSPAVRRCVEARSMHSVSVGVETDIVSTPELLRRARKGATDCDLLLVGKYDARLHCTALHDTTAALPISAHGAALLHRTYYGSLSVRLHPRLHCTGLYRTTRYCDTTHCHWCTHFGFLC